jgi:hypothetical protein
MSTINVSNLKNASAASPAIVLASDGSATAQLSSLNGGALSGARNKVINGGMVLDQRNAGSSVNVSADSYTLDRWLNRVSGGGVITNQRTSSVVPAGHAYALALTVQTADSSIAAGDVYQLSQRIEGFNTADLGWGAAGASTVTLSFWVRSSVTGTYGVGLQSAANTRSYVATYTINAANTWEYKSITITGDTSGSQNTGNGIGIDVVFDLGSGTSSNATAGSWGAGGSYWRTSGCVNWIANSGATFYITGVQLEAGSVATPYERRSYGQELALAQRYYQLLEGFTGTSYSTSTIAVGAVFRTEMRASPTVSATAAIQITYPGVNDYTQSSANASIVSGRISARGASVACANFSGLTNAIAHVHNVSVNSAAIAFSAEL